MPGPQHFQRWWAASPSLWFLDHAALRPWSTDLPPPDFRRHPARVQLTVGEYEQFAPDSVAAARRGQLQARRMVDNLRSLHTLIDGQPGVAAPLAVLPGRDHLEMLAHGARGVFGFAFESQGQGPGPSRASVGVGAAVWVARPQADTGSGGCRLSPATSVNGDAAMQGPAPSLTP